jgi:hypothetical protein
MQLFPARIVAVLAGALSLWAQGAPSPAARRAAEELEKTRKLVEAGALPRASLEKAQQAMREAEDDNLLRRTLYGEVPVEDLTEEQANEMVAAAQRQLANQQAKLDEARKLVDEGVAPRISLTPHLEELDRKKRVVDMAQSRAHLLRELAEMIRAEQSAVVAHHETPPISGKAMERYLGDGTLSTADLKKVILAFEKQFSKPLPISARGTTALHRALGFDHRGRVDVGLLPDTEEGIWLRQFLESERIPYYAFRRAIPGKATAAHIHIGPPSLRLSAAD